MEPDAAALPGPQDEAGWVALLLEHAGSGMELNLAADEEETDPARADAWPPGRQVPASAVRAVLLQLQRDPALADPRGLGLVCADILDRVDLAHLQVPCYLRLRRCRLAGGVTLDNAHIPGLSLEGSRLVGHGDASAMSAVGATITGQLAMSGADLTNEGGIALALDGADIGGGAFLDKGFSATGAVRAPGATIGGQLTMRSARLDNGNGIALYLAGASISGEVFLDEGFTAIGEVLANGATVTGRFILSEAALLNMTGETALTLDEASIGGDLLLDDVTATGEVRAHGATIGGQLNMRSAELIADGKTALHLDGVHIGGGAFLDEGFSATGEVRALHATVAGFLSMRGATLTNEGRSALILDGVSISGEVFLDEGFSATGAVRAPGATIGGQLSMRGATLTNEGGDALFLGWASIGGTAFLDEGFIAIGEVDALGATFRSDLRLRAATLTNEEGTEEDDVALNLDRANISGSALLDGGVHRHRGGPRPRRDLPGAIGPDWGRPHQPRRCRPEPGRRANGTVVAGPRGRGGGPGVAGGMPDRAPDLR